MTLDLARALAVTLIALLASVEARALTIDWGDAATWDAGNSPFNRATIAGGGQTFVNFGGTGLTALVTGVDNSTSDNLTLRPGDDTIVQLQDEPGLANPSITITFLNGTADLSLFEIFNLQASELQTISNPDSASIFLTQTSNNSGGLMRVNGTAVPALNVPVNGGSLATLQEQEDGAGSLFTATLSGVSGFTWAFESSFSIGSGTGLQIDISNVVPEPSTLLLVATGVVALAWRARLTRRCS